jgi:hypothetical protein
MKKFKIIFAVYAFLYSGYSYPVRPQTILTTISFLGAVGVLNIKRSWSKRTNSVEIARHIGNEEFLQQQKRERILYTGGAVLLEAGVAAAIVVPLYLRMPAVRVARARRIHNKILMQPRFVPLHTLERNRGLLDRACWEVGKAKAVFETCDMEKELSEALALERCLELNLATTKNEIREREGR